MDTLEEIQNATETFKTLKIGDNRYHVIRPFERNSTQVDEPNYRGTGNAFVGVLKKDETLEMFKERYIDMKLKNLNK